MRPMLSSQTAGLLVLMTGISLAGCGETGGPDDPDTIQTDAVISGHEAVAAFTDIPLATIESIRTNYRLFYGHTSHGSQIISGLDMLEAENPAFAPPDFRREGDDLGHNGDVSWVPITRDVLDDNPGDFDVVMWSWCGGASDNTEEGIQAYLDAMAQLEEDYPDVVFVYMPGHLDGTGENGNLRARNNQIRTYAAANDKVLFDFAAIESYDPDGIFYPNGSDDCAWCTNWCAANTCSACSSCAHSHCFNCYQKGKAFWWMMARIAGWEPTS